MDKHPLAPVLSDAIVLKTASKRSKVEASARVESRQRRNVGDLELEVGHAGIRGSDKVLDVGDGCAKVVRLCRKWENRWRGGSNCKGGGVCVCRDTCNRVKHSVAIPIKFNLDGLGGGIYASLAHALMIAVTLAV